MNITLDTTAQEVFQQLTVFLEDYPLTENRTSGRQLLGLDRDALCLIYGSPQGVLIYAALHRTQTLAPFSGVYHFTCEIMSLMKPLISSCICL